MFSCVGGIGGYTETGVRFSRILIPAYVLVMKVLVQQNSFLTADDQF